jgi:hypothetical protein
MPGRQIAEPALIAKRSALQQLCEQGKRLICEILIDEGLLSAKGFGGTARWLIVLLSFAGDDLRIQLSYGQQPILLLSIGRVVRLPEDKLSAGCVVPEIELVQHPRTQQPAIDRAPRLSGINATDDDVNLRCIVRLDGYGVDSLATWVKDQNSDASLRNASAATLLNSTTRGL